ncbi:phage BR0599 family protein, partial [Guyparkeria sp. 1SP6A2]|nr:phage BR0599 family protein [Guyparkeria sp. 1SP6A2]
FLGLEVGQEIEVYPGCDRTAATCNAKFNNLLNYGGFDFIPPKGPFEGTSIVSGGDMGWEYFIYAIVMMVVSYLIAPKPKTSP